MLIFVFSFFTPFSSPGASALAIFARASHLRFLEKFFVVS